MPTADEIKETLEKRLCTYNAVRGNITIKVIRDQGEVRIQLSASEVAVGLTSFKTPLHALCWKSPAIFQYSNLNVSENALTGQSLATISISMGEAKALFAAVDQSLRLIGVIEDATHPSSCSLLDELARSLVSGPSLQPQQPPPPPYHLGEHNWVNEISPVKDAPDRRTIYQITGTGAQGDRIIYVELNRSGTDVIGLYDYQRRKILWNDSVQQWCVVTERGAYEPIGHISQQMASQYRKILGHFRVLRVSPQVAPLAPPPAATSQPQYMPPPQPLPGAASQSSAPPPVPAISQPLSVPSYTQWLQQQGVCALRENVRTVPTKAGEKLTQLSIYEYEFRDLTKARDFINKYHVGHRNQQGDYYFQTHLHDGSLCYRVLVNAEQRENLRKAYLQEHPPRQLSPSDKTARINRIDAFLATLTGKDVDYFNRFYELATNKASEGWFRDQALRTFDLSLERYEIIQSDLLNQADHQSISNFRRILKGLQEDDAYCAGFTTSQSRRADDTLHKQVDRYHDILLDGGDVGGRSQTRRKRFFPQSIHSTDPHTDPQQTDSIFINAGLMNGHYAICEIHKEWNQAARQYDFYHIMHNAGAGNNATDYHYVSVVQKIKPDSKTEGDYYAQMRQSITDIMYAHRRITAFPPFNRDQNPNTGYRYWNRQIFERLEPIDHTRSKRGALQTGGNCTLKSIDACFSYHSDPTFDTDKPSFLSSDHWHTSKSLTASTTRIGCEVRKASLEDKKSILGRVGKVVKRVGSFIWDQMRVHPRKTLAIVLGTVFLGVITAGLGPILVGGAIAGGSIAAGLTAVGASILPTASVTMSAFIAGVIAGVSTLGIVATAVGAIAETVYVAKSVAKEMKAITEGIQAANKPPKIGSASSSGVSSSVAVIGVSVGGISQLAAVSPVAQPQNNTPGEKLPHPQPQVSIVPFGREGENCIRSVVRLENPSLIYITAYNQRNQPRYFTLDLSRSPGTLLQHSVALSSGNAPLYLRDLTPIGRDLQAALTNTHFKKSLERVFEVDLSLPPHHGSGMRPGM